MTLRDAAHNSLESAPHMRFSPVLSGEPRVVRRELETIEKFGLGSTLMDPPDLDEICERLRATLRKNPESISRRDMRYAPACIWSGAHPIADDQALLQLLLERILQVGRRSLARALASAYFRWFSPDRTGIKLIGQALALMAEQNLPALAKMHSQNCVFDPELGPQRIANTCLASSVPPLRFMQSYGLAAHALVSGFGSSVFAEGMRRIREDIGREQKQSLVHLASEWADEPADLAYRDANPTLANTLLLPFASREPSEEIKDEVLGLLLDRIGDPRTKSQNWVRMREAADVARRWLTRLALRQFLDIVDDVAYRSHWDYRRAFWLAFYEKGYVQEAWVAFGPTGADKARRSFGRNASFGRLQADRKQVEHGHTVLLMRIGDYTVIDWSHNGRCIIWPSKDPASPRLYQPTYRSGDLAPYGAPKEGFEKSHMGAPNYSWQRDVAAFLRRKAGVRVNDRDFAVH